ncbi:unnamed protein product [Echinostoma caproni]|uniref:Mlh1_C domain-containing protein n=1 Tax=Echinostoma caproni TaxID=27848 RepID=A0A183AAD8_9TREM|nr:unnamed protein product [Echinostoma caproni]
MSTEFWDVKPIGEAWHYLGDYFTLLTLHLSSLTPTTPGRVSDVGNSSVDRDSVNDSGRATGIRPHEKIRTDAREQRLERFISHPSTTLSSSSLQPSKSNKDATLDEPPSSPTLDDLDDLIQEDGENRPPEERKPTSEPHSPTKSDCLSPIRRSSTDATSLTAKPVVTTPLKNSILSDTNSLSPDLLRPSSTLDRVNRPSVLPPMPKRRLVRLQSVLQMRRRLEQQVDPEARRLLRTSKFVGCVDRTCCLVQHETDLLLIRLHPLTRAYFYQLSVTNFANHGEDSGIDVLPGGRLSGLEYADDIVLLSGDPVFNEPVALLDLVELAQSRLRGANESGSIQAVQIVETLLSHAAMLWDYFSIRIEQASDGRALLYGIPLLLDNRYVPDLDRLPLFVTRLGTEVTWTEEAVCFENLCRILADFYAIHSPLIPQSTDTSEVDAALTSRSSEVSSSSTVPWRWMIEHVVWPAVATGLWPARGLLYESPPIATPGQEKVPSTACFRLTRLADLYKVFERC